MCQETFYRKPFKVSRELNWNDFKIEEVLRKGEFCDTFKARLNRTEENQTADDALFTLKCIKKNSYSVAMEAGAKVLSYETALLSKMNHPNVIKVRGLSSGFKKHRHFALFEMVEETLTSRIQYWKDKNSKSVRLGSKERLKKNVPSLDLRMRDFALSIASAMRYVHSHGILLRNLSPDNIGFDRHGQVKLIDFSMSGPLFIRGERQELKAQGMRYRSPETLLGKESGFPSDVFSFAIILWEIATLHTPYPFVDRKGIAGGKILIKKVGKQGVRPSTRGIKKRPIRLLLDDSMHTNPDARPSFARIWLILSELCSPPRGYVSTRGLGKGNVHNLKLPKHLYSPAGFHINR
jgi:serine/threonine protein kinase